MARESLQGVLVVVEMGHAVRGRFAMRSMRSLLIRVLLFSFFFFCRQKDGSVQSSL